MPTPVHASLFIEVLRHASGLARRQTALEHDRVRAMAMQARMQHDLDMFRAYVEREQSRMSHERDISSAYIAAAQQMFDSLLTKRVDAVQAAFNVLVKGFDDQAKHCMGQQNRLLDSQLECIDPLGNARIHKRLADVDAQLNAICDDVRRVWSEYLKTLVAFGVPLPRLDRSVVRRLGIDE